MRIGVLISSNRKKDIRKQFSDLQERGFTSCQLLLWPHYDDLTDERAVEIRNAAAEFGVEITHFWCGWPGYHKWDNYSGYINLGIVPPSTRALRVATLLRGSDFAKILGVKKIRNIYSFLCVIIYILMGILWNLWHPGWIIFLTIPVVAIFTSKSKVEIID